MKTVLWSMLCLFLSGWGSMQAVLAQDLKEMEKNLSAINEELSQKTKEYSWQLAAAYADYCEANNKYISWNDLPYLQQVVEYERPASLETYRLEHKASKEELLMARKRVEYLWRMFSLTLMTRFTSSMLRSSSGP